jgi:hypothetical protein
MMPHLGVLSSVNEQAATEVFTRDCLIYLGTCVAPIGQGKDGERCADYDITFSGGRPPEKGTLAYGELRLIPLTLDERAKVELRPAKLVSLGKGNGVPVTQEVRGGVVGLLLDGRGRPLVLAKDDPSRLAALMRWAQAVNLYPQK